MGLATVFALGLAWRARFVAELFTKLAVEPAPAAIAATLALRALRCASLACGRGLYARLPGLLSTTAALRATVFIAVLTMGTPNFGEQLLWLNRRLAFGDSFALDGGL